MKKYIILFISVLFLNSYTIAKNNNTNRIKLDTTTSLLGTDSNNNGIRDDIDLLIQKNLKDPLQVKTIERLARSLQRILTIGDDISTAQTVSLKHMNALQCTHVVFTTETKPKSEYIIQLIKESTFNTPSRKNAYKQYKRNLNDFTPTLSNEPNCN